MRASFAPLLLVVLACASARRPPIDPETGRPVTPAATGWAEPLGAALRVRYDPVRDVRMARVDSSVGGPAVLDTTLCGVSELYGRLRASAGDTLWLAVTMANDAAGQGLLARRRGVEWTARVERREDIDIKLLSAHPERAERVAGGAVLGAAGGALLVSIYCALRRCD